VEESQFDCDDHGEVDDHALAACFQENL